MCVQEEITQGVVSLSVETGKMTADLLQKAVKKVLEEMQKKPSQRSLHQGKQTLHQLKQHGASLTNIEITEQNIKAFSAVAKKYDIDAGLQGVHRHDPEPGEAPHHPGAAGPGPGTGQDPAPPAGEGQDQGPGGGAMTDKLKKQLILNLPYLVFVYLFEKLCQGVRLAPGADASEKLLHIGQGFSVAFASLAPSFHLLDLCVGAAGAVLIRLAVYSKGKNAKKYRRGIEYGSARWGTPADIAPYVDKDFSQNVLLTQTERITMSSRPKEPKYARNKNILVIGGSGSGKTRFFVKPNLLQCHSSYVVTDPKGTILQEVGALLERRQYRIKSLNLINFKKSMKYNPLAYIRSEKDILKLVNALILNTKGEGEKSSEDFWVKAERLYYSALIGYIWYEAEPEERNFITLLDLINASEAREDDEEFQSPVDILFAKLEKEQPDHFAVKQYRKFKMAAGKTLKSILISCGARLSPFDIQELRDLMAEDELELDTLGDRKSALFVILSDTDSTFNFVAALMYSQLFNLLCDKADDFYGGRLPVHVRCLLDEFANIGQIPNFEKLIATIRSREISASIILQSQSQLKTIYKDAADTIVGNCDSTLFLGGKEKSTLKEISELLGKETIDSFNQSENRGSQVSHGLTYQ